MISCLRKLKNKFKYAIEGFFDGVCKDRSIKIQCFLALCAIVASIIFQLSLMEWCIVLVLIFLVIAFEFINSAIEELANYLSIEYDLRIKKIKDYSAAAVLLVSMSALVVAVVFFGGKLWMFLH